MGALPYLDLPRVRQAQGVMALPGSKSISNRVLLLSAIAEGTTTITGLLDSDDTLGAGHCRRWVDLSRILAQRN